MDAFVTHRGVVAPFDRANVDTDLIIPKQFLKSVKKSGFGPHLFDQLRYRDEGQPGMDNSQRPLREDFVLNQPRYAGASILLTRENFGCGSSREHAPWALLDHGFRVILAPSFADIFANNCIKNGILTVVLSPPKIERLFAEVVATPGYELDVSLEEQVVRLPSGDQFLFDFDPSSKECLLKGLDDIGLTLLKAELIEAYEKKRQAECPWLFSDNL
jgi:3-isopropylmalate/(R)-2-methylmalate dehydratase small subunit